jgi:hypothetical protein
MKRFAVTILIIGCIASCQQSPKAIKDPNNTSEMALAMRDMYKELLAVKKNIEGSKQLSEKHLSFPPIQSLKPTDSTFIKPGFRESSIRFSRSIKLFNEDPSVESYRAIVMGCTSCHKALCPGPLVRIENLEIN